MIDLNEEAEEWAFWGPNSHRWSNNNDTAADNFGSFIAGANSKYVQAKILKAQMDILMRYATKGYNMEELIRHGEILEQQLKQLENEI